MNHNPDNGSAIPPIHIPFTSFLQKHDPTIPPNQRHDPSNQIARLSSPKRNKENPESFSFGIQIDQATIYMIPFLVNKRDNSSLK